MTKKHSGHTKKGLPPIVRITDVDGKRKWWYQGKKYASLREFREALRVH